MYTLTSVDIIRGLLGLFPGAAVPPASKHQAFPTLRPSDRKSRAVTCFRVGIPQLDGAVESGIMSRFTGWRASFSAPTGICGAFILVAYRPEPRRREMIGWECIGGSDYGVP